MEEKGSNKKSTNNDRYFEPVGTSMQDNHRNVANLVNEWKMQELLL